MFPDRWPGTGLLLLRSAAGAVLIIHGIAYFGEGRHPGIVAPAVACAMGLLGLLLLIGFMTRFVALAAVAVSLACALSWLPASNAGPLVSPSTGILSAVIAVAVTCMGPGAMSLDARFFGRREIIIPASLPKQ